MSLGKVLIGLTVGVAAGAILGVLYAPDKGSITRRRFSKSGFEYTDDMEAKFNELIDSITDQFETVVQDVNRMAEENKMRSERAENT